MSLDAEIRVMAVLRAAAAPMSECDIVNATATLTLEPVRPLLVHLALLRLSDQYCGAVEKIGDGWAITGPSPVVWCEPKEEISNG
jgi:hypothetical protein